MILDPAQSDAAHTLDITSKRLVEIRTYKLKPRTLAAYDRLIGERAVPLLRDSKMEIVAFGASLHADDAYFLIRSYRNLDDRSAQQDAFYASCAWREGPREEILALIESYFDAVFWLTPAAIDDLRRLNPSAKS